MHQDENIIKKEYSMNWYLTVIKNYVGFKGRARRKEYWMFILFNMIFMIAALILDNMLGTTQNGVVYGDIGYGPIYGLYTLAVFLPALAVLVRRLHDIGKSGWMILITLIPIIGAIWLFVLLVTEGELTRNKYGSNPKEIT